MTPTTRLARTSATVSVLAATLVASACQGKLFRNQRGGAAKVTVAQLDLPTKERHAAFTASGWHQQQMICRMRPEPWAERETELREEAVRRYMTSDELERELRKARVGYAPGTLWLRVKVEARNKRHAENEWTFVLVDQGGAVHRPELVEAVDAEATMQDRFFYQRRFRVRFAGLAPTNLYPGFGARCVPPVQGVPEIEIRWSVDKDGADWLLGTPERTLSASPASP